MKSKKKKSTKAVTLLNQIEALLSDLVAECAVVEKGVEKNVRELLRSAEASVAMAKDFFTPSSAVQKTPRSRTRAAGAKNKASVRARKRAVARAA
jgi:hypothetical protein